MTLLEFIMGRWKKEPPCSNKERVDEVVGDLRRSAEKSKRALDHTTEARKAEADAGDDVRDMLAETVKRINSA